jgi:hypothetical protein
LASEDCFKKISEGVVKCVVKANGAEAAGVRGFENFATLVKGGIGNLREEAMRKARIANMSEADKKDCKIVHCMNGKPMMCGPSPCMRPTHQGRFNASAEVTSLAQSSTFLD